VTRTLSLRKECLAELTTAELEVVNGASGIPCNTLESVLPTCGPCTPLVITLDGCI
jgi:hypothetical protein